MIRLGLAAVPGIVRSHGGAISVESSPGVGSAFTVLRPANSGKAELPEPENDRPTARRLLSGTGAILVVDDEEIVRRTARAAIERYGYAVFEAADGRDALDLFGRPHDRLSALLLELSSGYDEAEAMKPFSPEPDLYFIKKPYSAAALAARFTAVLGGEARAV